MNPVQKNSYSSVTSGKSGNVEKSIPNSSKYVLKVNNVHNDDIHGLISQKDSFISGSKDGTIKIWSPDLYLQQEIPALSLDGNIDYRFWVTSLLKLSDNSWVSGSRNGILRVFDENHYCNSQTAFSVGSNHNSKQRNMDRISCLAEVHDNTLAGSKVIVGLANELHVFDIKKSSACSKSKVSENDWVYCVQHLNNNRYLVVIGSVLEVWDHFETGFSKYSTLLEENKKEITYVNKKPQRPFISAIESIDPTLLAMVDFSGRVKVINLETGKLTHNTKCHQNRAWSVKKITEQTFATSADDRTIKIWDLRQNKQISTFNNHPGRVSTLLMKNEFEIIACSCPDDVYKQNEKASFTLWDTRVSIL